MRVALAAFLIAAPAAAQLATPTDKVPRVEAAETRFGIATADPYRWMEEPARAGDVAAFVRAMSASTVAQLAKLPQRAAFAATLEESSRAGVRYVDARAAGRVLVYRRLDPTDAVYKLVVREDGAERVLFDPAAGQGNAAIGSWTLSPDGRTVALHVSEKGSEVGAVRFLDVRSGREVHERLSPVWGETEVAWLTPTRIGYSLMDPKSPDPSQNSRAFVRDLAGGPAVPVLGPEIAGSPKVDRTEFAVIDDDGIGDWVLGAAANARADQRLFAARRGDLARGKPAWRSIAALSDQVSWGTTRGGAIFLLTTKGTPLGRIERLDPASGSREVVPTPDGLVLTDLLAAREGLYVTAQKDGAARLLYLPDGRGPARPIELPFESDFAVSAPAADGRGITFSLMGWTTPPRSYRALDGKLEPLGLDSVGWNAAAGFDVRREEAVSADGTRVPLVVITPRGRGPWPTLLEAYGAYGAPTATPWYNSYMLSWTGRGGGLAFCGTRGGNERGRSWHDGGRERNKVNAHADYIACAERLIALDVARPGGIAATGTSAGGLLAPVAVQRRPELFGALLPRVAILNPSRLEKAPNGPNQFSEMGDPRTEDGYRALVSQDAYLALASAKDLPDTLVTVGLNDQRVTPWMGAKFAAHARDRFGEKRLIMLRADAEAGHGVGSTRDVLVNEWADVFAFLADRLKANAR
jgi:prolyl oligopeptidase